MMLRRLALLYAGLVLYGVSSALMVRARLGLGPWNVLHQGIAARTSLSFGTVIIVVGATLMLAWIPLRQRPGLGTMSNVVLIGLVADAALALIPAPDLLAARVALLVGSVAMNGIATGMYIGAGLGPGPRDGLMTGLAALTGWPIRRTRTGIEVCVLVVGWLLGGTVGLGTVLYALMIGPIIHVTLPAFEGLARKVSRGAPVPAVNAGDLR